MEDDHNYLLNLVDCDGDTITVHELTKHERGYMMRIENDDVLTGIIVDGPMAMALVGVLLPLVRDFKIDQYLDIEVE